MTMTSWPYVAQAATDVEYGRLYREMAGSDGVVGSYGDGALRCTGDGSGMLVKMAAGSAVMRGYMFYSTAIENITIGAPSPAVRMDRVVLELSLSEPSVADRIKPKVLPGTSGSMTPDNLTQTETGIYHIGLSLVQVDPGVSSIAANKVFDDRSWMDQRIGAWTTSKRPSSPRKYKLGFNETLGYYEYWNGSEWISLSAVNLESSLVTGVLPMTKGGTGQNNAVSALNALGVYVQSSEPAYAANRVWIKVP